MREYTRVVIKRDDNREGWLKLFFDYQPEFIIELKKAIPSPFRKYVAEQKYWEVKEEFLKVIVVLCDIYFAEVRDEVTVQQPIVQSNIFCELFKMVPSQYLEKVYLSLAQAVHPDHGGSNEIMKLLNIAYQQKK